MTQSKQTNIFLFYGEDTYSSSQKIQHWKKEFVRKHEDINLEIIEAKELNPKNFITNIESLPFLAEKRMIIIKNFLSKGKTDDQKKIAETIDNVPEFCILVFHESEQPDKRTSLYKKISKIGEVTEFPELKPQQITNWILDRAKERDISIKPPTAMHLTQHCGHELWTISSELEKLQMFADNKEITTKMIDNLCTPSITASVFKLTDAIATKNIKESVKVLKALNESGEDMIKVFFMIVRHFRILIQVKELLSKNEYQGAIAKRLKQHPFVVQTISAQAPNFTQEQLKKIYEQLLQIDIETKTGIIKSYQGDTKELQLAMEKLIINSCG